MPYDEVVDGYRIIQIMSEETAPGQSPEVVYFAIKDEKTGEIIFESNGKTVENQISDFTDKFEDLRDGMVLTGTVRNVTDFGAFVDIGVKHDGLVHISQLSNSFVKSPSDVVSVGDIVKVKVIGIDQERQKVQLSMKDV